MPTWLLQVFGRQRGKLHGCTWLMDINMHYIMLRRTGAREVAVGQVVSCAVVPPWNIVIILIHFVFCTVNSCNNL